MLSNAALDGLRGLLLETPSPGGPKEQAATVSDSIEAPLDSDFAATVADLTDDQKTATTDRLASTYYCCKGAVVGLSPNQSQALIIPTYCKSWDCPTCGPIKRRQWVRRLAAGKPERALTLTCPSGKFKDAKTAARAMKKAWVKLAAKIRERFKVHPAIRWLPPAEKHKKLAAMARRGKTLGPFPKFKLAYAMLWELQKNGTPHMHILLRGDKIPQGWLSYWWMKFGIGPIVHICYCKNYTAEALHATKSYGGKRKSIESYITEDVSQTAASLAPLRIVQVSNNWDLVSEEDAWKVSHEGWFWSSTRTSPNEILRRWMLSHTALSYKVNWAGVIEVEKVPRVSDTGLMAQPGQAPPSDFW